MTESCRNQVSWTLTWVATFWASPKQHYCRFSFNMDEVDAEKRKYMLSCWYFSAVRIHLLVKLTSKLWRVGEWDAELTAPSEGKQTVKYGNLQSHVLIYTTAKDGETVRINRIKIKTFLYWHSITGTKLWQSHRIRISRFCLRCTSTQLQIHGSNLTSSKMSHQWVYLHAH